MKRMAQHGWVNPWVQDSAVHLHLKVKNKSFEDDSVNILARQERWFERGVKESIYVKLDQPSFNSGGGLRHCLSLTYNAAWSSLTRQIKNHSLLGSPSLSNPHEGQLGQQPMSGPDDSEIQSSQVSLTL